MSLTYNRFKNTTIKGIFQNIDNDVDAINASSYIQRDLTIDGYLISNGGISITIGSNTYILTKEILSYLSTISSNVQTQITNNSSNITSNTSNISTNTSNITSNTSNIATNTSNIATLNTKCTEITYDNTSDTTTITNFVNITKEMTVNSLVIPSSQLLTLTGNIYTNGISITPIVLSYISTLSSNAQTQLTTNATNIGINADNITTLTTQVNSLNTNTNGITYSSSNTNFSNLVYANAGLNLPISQVLTILGNLYCNSTTITPIHLSYLSGLTGNVQNSLNLLSPLNSPVFTGSPKAPTQASSDNSTNIATTAFVNTAINNLIGGASSAYDTLLEIQNVLTTNSSAISSINSAIAGKASLSDIQNNNNVWVGTNAFNTSLPTTSITSGFSNNNFITKSYADATYTTSGNILSSSNTFTGTTNTFQNVITNALSTSSINNSGVLNSTGLITANGGLNIATGQLLTLIGDLYVNTTTISPTVLSYLSGLSSNVQSQINSKTTLSTIQSNSNVWSGTNTFNSSLPTSTISPSGSTDLITKSYGDTSYPILSNSNTFSNTNTFNGSTVINRFTSSTGFPSSPSGLTDSSFYWNTYWNNTGSGGSGDLSFVQRSGAGTGGYAFYTLGTNTSQNPILLFSANRTTFSVPTGSTLTSGAHTATTLTSSGLTTANSLSVSTTSTFTGQATFNGTNIGVNVGIASSSLSGSSLAMGLRFSSGGKTTILFNGANAGSFNNNLILVNDCGIAYNTNNSGTAGYCICPQASSSLTQGLRLDYQGNLSETGTLTVSGNTTLSSNLTVSGTSTLNSNTYINTASGSSAIGLVINNSNPAGSGVSKNALQITQGGYGCQIQGILEQGVGATFSISTGEKTTPSWNIVMSGNQNTLNIASTTTSINNLSMTGVLSSTITTNNNVIYGTNSVILTSNTTLSWPLNKIIFVNAPTTAFSVTLPTLTSVHDGLEITIRALPTCTQNVAINFSSSQVIYLNNASSLTTYNMINTSPVLRLTVINNSWMQI